MLPGPKSVPTRSVLSSTHATPDFASGTLNPSATKCRVVRSNSRNSVASEPPRERPTRQRRYSGSRQDAPAQDHVTPSALLNELRSITVSHPGVALAELAPVVRRQMPPP